MTTSVLFWFDVEDYITPASDDALKGLLEIFESHGVQASWRLVAEKARVLEARGRTDIIRLLQRQDIGYHTDNHSIHPVLAEYLRDMGWEDGVQEVFRREASGYRDLTRICGPSSSFGQAGASWAPQIYPVLQELDIPLFMDEAPHVGLDGEPFFYCRTLHINRMESRCTGMRFRHGEQGLEEGKRRFDAILADNDQGGLVSIYYHPCEWATQAFWDGVNFGNGANPPRPEWEPAPLRTQEEMRGGLELFSRYLGHVKDSPGAEIITARQVLNLLPDDASDLHIDLGELAEITNFRDGAIGYRRLDGCSLSPSELFSMVAEGLMLCLNEEEQSGHGGHLHTPTPTPYGPTRRLGSSLDLGTPLPSAALLEGAADALQFIEVHERLPDCVWLGSEHLSPADFLVTAGELLRAAAGGSIPESIPLRAGTVELERHIGDHPWGWVVFPAGFEAPGILELARLQTWTLKPALLAA